MRDYLFIFGRTPALSRLELTTFFPQRAFVNTSVALVRQERDPMEIMRTLGGTVKIVEILGRIPSISTRLLAGYISGQTFGISVYQGEKISRQFLEEIKRLRPGSRFIEARDGGALSSVVVEKGGVFDLVIVKDADKYFVGKTVAVQPFEEWNKRDYQRPFVDPARGMLPPKVARMIVNIAGVGKGRVLLDPFCGMGTIVGEAVMMGWTAIGTDQSPEVITQAMANLVWLRREYPALTLGTASFFAADATHVSTVVTAGSVDAIVTEPFMGSQKTASAADTKNILRGLEKLYLGCLKQWRHVLKPQGKIIMALPQYHVLGKTYTVKTVIDRCETLGYTTLAGPIEYSRPQAKVRREFYIFQKK